MEAKVRLDSMLQYAEDMKKINAELNQYEKELERSRKVLEQLSGMETPLKKLRQCGERMEAENRYCMSFGDIIKKICGLYGENEIKLVNDSENMQASIKRETFAKQDLGSLYKIFHKVFL